MPIVIRQREAKTPAQQALQSALEVAGGLAGARVALNGLIEEAEPIFVSLEAKIADLEGKDHEEAVAVIERLREYVT